MSQVSLDVPRTGYIGMYRNFITQIMETQMEERSNMRWKLRGPAQPRKFSHVEDPGPFVFGRLVCQKVVWAYSDPGSLMIHREPKTWCHTGPHLQFLKKQPHSQKIDRTRSQLRCM